MLLVTAAIASLTGAVRPRNHYHVADTGAGHIRWRGLVTGRISVTAICCTVAGIGRVIINIATTAEMVTGAT